MSAPEPATPTPPALSCTRCRRCAAPLPGLERGPGVSLRDGALVFSSDQTFAFPLCLTHAKEARDLLLHYVEHRLSVLPGNRLCLTLGEGRPAPRQQEDQT